MEGREAALRQNVRMDRPGVRLGRSGRGQGERNPARARRGGDRNRRRADVPGGRVVPRHPQGGPAGPRPRRRRVSFRRVLSVPRRGRRGGPGGGARHHPAGWLREGRGGDRGGRSARPGDGADRPAAVPALTTMTSTPSMRDRLTPYADAERPPYPIASVVLPA